MLKATRVCVKLRVVALSVPGRTALSKEFNCVLIELKAKITIHLESANKISICCDVWSKKGLTSSYLGFFYPKKK